jgi:hypothetical protein
MGYLFYFFKKKLKKIEVDEQYEVKNGLFGLKRDLIIKLGNIQKMKII